MNKEGIFRHSKPDEKIIPFEPVTQSGLSHVGDISETGKKEVRDAFVSDESSAETDILPWCQCNSAEKTKSLSYLILCIIDPVIDENHLPPSAFIAPCEGEIPVNAYGLTSEAVEELKTAVQAGYINHGAPWYPTFREKLNSM